MLYRAHAAIPHRQSKVQREGHDGLLLHPERLEEPLHWKKPRACS